MVKPRLLQVAACAMLAGGPAQAVECRLALVLAIDVSSSVDEAEDRLQRSGLAAALISPDVQAAFFGADLPVALAVFEWSGRYNQSLLVDWQLVTGPETLQNIALAIQRSDRSEVEFPTAMGYALGYGAGLLRRGPTCLFRTLDMAGDGINNEGFVPDTAYGAFPFEGVTVNGLVIAAPDTPDGQEVIRFYQDQVLNGPGAFLEQAHSFDDYEDAMRRKLEREVSARTIGHLAVPAPDIPG